MRGWMIVYLTPYRLHYYNYHCLFNTYIVLLICWHLVSMCFKGYQGLYLLYTTHLMQMLFKFICMDFMGDCNFNSEIKTNFKFKKWSRIEIKVRKHQDIYIHGCTMFHSLAHSQDLIPTLAGWCVALIIMPTQVGIKYCRFARECVYLCIHGCSCYTQWWMSL